MDNCKLINIVWIDRGILLSIIAYIINSYQKLLNKNNIINIKHYRYLLRNFFPDLKFYKYKGDDNNNFYFNIRTIIKKQNVVIDYLHNYDNEIATSKLQLIPWYDTNDPLIIYELNDNTINARKYKSFIKKFSSCRRGNYFGHPWDICIETLIFNKYQKLMMVDNYKKIIDLFNKTLMSNYMNTGVYINVLNPYIFNTHPTKNTKQTKNINNDTVKPIPCITEQKNITDEKILLELLNLFTDKISKIINIMK